MALNSPIAAIIVKFGNVFKQKDSIPVAIVKNWIIARPSVLFSSITPVQKKIFYRQFKDNTQQALTSIIENKNNQQDYSKLKIIIFTIKITNVG